MCSNVMCLGTAGSSSFHSRRLPVDHCPACNKPLDAAASISGEDVGPQPGDVTLCIGCGTFLEYGEDMRLMLLTDAHKDEISAEDLDRLEEIQTMIRTRLL